MDVGVNSDAELAISVMPLPKAKIPVVQNLVVVDKAINALVSPQMTSKVKIRVYSAHKEGNCSPPDRQCAAQHLALSKGVATPPWRCPEG